MSLLEREVTKRGIPVIFVWGRAGSVEVGRYIIDVRVGSS